MRKMMAASLAAALTCIAVPVSTVCAQRGISTNPVSLETRDYLGGIHALSKYEVDASRLALIRSKARATQAFAHAMVDHHVRLIAEHARLLRIPKGAEPGSALSGPLSEMLNSLENTSAGEFDAAYRMGQIAAHEEALKVHEAYLAGGSDRAWRQKAQQAVLSIRKHLDAARKLPAA